MTSLEFDFQKQLIEFEQRQEQGVVPRDGYAIPYQQILEVLRRLDYATHERVMFGMLALSGCRICELDRMKRDGFIGDKFFWTLGKGQKGNRSVQLPDYYIAELREYWKWNRIRNLDMFGKKAISFVRDFNKRIRDNLPPEWKQYAYEYGQMGIEQCYRFQLKGLRKSWSTLRFAWYWDRLKDATAAMEFVSKEMKHSTKSMTCHHYLENFQTLEVEKYKGKLIADLLRTEKQEKLLYDYTLNDGSGGKLAVRILRKHEDIEQDGGR